VVFIGGGGKRSKKREKGREALAPPLSCSKHFHKGQILLAYFSGKLQGIRQKRKKSIGSIIGEPKKQKFGL